MKEKLQCDNCGGILEHEGHDIFNCKYCGMKYKITGWERKEELTFGDFVKKVEDKHVIKTIIAPSKFNVIRANVVVSDEVRRYRENVNIEELVKRQLSDKIAEYIYNNFDDIVELYRDTDLCYMQTTYSASIRVLNEGGSR